MSDDKPRIGAGDVELDLDGERVVLRPTLRTAQRLSRQSGGLARAIERVGNLELDAMVEVVQAGTGKDGSDIADKVWRTGLPPLAAPCIRFLSNLANGGRPASESEGSDHDEADPPN